MPSIDNLLLIFSLLLIVAIITTKFSSRLGLPSLVFFIAVGMFLNNYIYYDNATLTQNVGTVALIVILFEGGLQTKWTNVKSVLLPSALLATLGVVLTSLVIGICAKFILHLTWLEGMLFGAIVGSTDAAAVFAVLGEKNISPKLTATLEAESGSNDPMAIFLTVSFIQIMQLPETKLFVLFGKFFWQMGLGLILGMIFGKFAIWLINKINLDSSGLYPVLSTALASLAYCSTALLQGSGFLAVYIMAIFIGNADLTYRNSIFKFNEGLAWLMHIIMFMLLGLLSFPKQLISIFWQGIFLSFLLMFLARPIGVFLSLICIKYSLKEKVLISWAGLRGAVPIVLATYPVAAGLSNGQLIFNVVFFVVLTSALLQGATISPLAEKFGLTTGKRITAPHSLELVSMMKTNAEIMEIILERENPIIGKKLKELNFPQDTLISAIIRQNKVIAPRGSTILEAEDVLYVLLPKTKRKAAKEILLNKHEIFNTLLEKDTV